MNRTIKALLALGMAVSLQERSTMSRISSTETWATSRSSILLSLVLNS